MPPTTTAPAPPPADEVLTAPPMAAGSNETTPLLGGSTPEGQRSSKLSFAAVWAIRIVLGALASVTLVLLSSLPVVYFVYIPLRLQKGSGDSSLQLNNVHVDGITNDTLQIRINATQFVKEPPPLDIYMSNVDFLLCLLGTAPPPEKRSRPSLFPPRIPVSWQDEDRYLNLPRHVTPPVVLSLPFPGLVSRKGSDEVAILFHGDVQRLDKQFIPIFVTEALGYFLASTTPEPGPAPNALTFRQQGVPTMRIPGIGHWRIPLWTYFRYDPKDATAPKQQDGGVPAGPLDAFNVTVEEQNVGYEGVEVKRPDGTIETVQVLSVNVSTSFTNNYPFTFGPIAGEERGAGSSRSLAAAGEPLHPHVAFSIFYQGSRILRLRVFVGPPAASAPTSPPPPLPTQFSVASGRNPWGLRVVAQADPDGAEPLSEWIGKYAEGLDTVVGLSEFRTAEFVVVGGVPEWVERMLTTWSFKVLVPGAKEEDVRVASLAKSAAEKQALRAVLGLAGVVGERLARPAAAWLGVEKSFRRKFGGIVASTIRVGYSGGHKEAPTYKEVCTGTTNHAEVIHFQFDPAQTSYATLLDFFFRMHDPTTKDRQGNDRGTQYRSAIFYHDAEQKRIAEEVISKVRPAFGNSGVATTVEPFVAFFDGEEYHQDYLTKNPHGYECATHFERTWDKIAAEYGGTAPKI
ncbi:Peptide-methionine (S)-S-oxide reductase [Phlyctochytrium bullatum]|nr:Peptide-methionine (S)-S-oxide reductase [Phlyctochytrium bullatum]